MKHLYEKSNLDLLRSFAVLAVVLDHTCLAAGVPVNSRWGITSLGFFGVCLFFVHTSLVLMWSLERQPDTLGFYIRRAFRIYPLAIAVVIFVVSLNLLLKDRIDPSLALPIHDAKLVTANLLLVQNLFHYPSVLGVLWSLPLELQMYLALPVLFAFAQKEKNIWPLVTLWAGASVGAWFLLPHYLDGADIFGFLPNFIPGVVAYVGFRNRTERLPAWSFILLLPLVAVVYMAAPLRRTSWACCLVLGLTLPLFRQVKTARLDRLVHEIAKYSYSIYLIHILAISAGFHYLHLHSLVARVCVELALIAAVAPLAYRFIEKPLMAHGAKLAARLTGKRLQVPLMEVNPAP